MAPRRTTRSTVDQETVNATTVTNAQLQTMIDQGVTAALAAHDALRSTNGDDSHNSGTDVRRTERAARECTYSDFLKCQPLLFKGTEGVASLFRLRHVLENAHEDDDGQIFSSKRDQETRNGTLRAEGFVLNIFASMKLTDSIFNEMLKFFQQLFPTTKGYKLPPSYYAINKTFKTIGLGYESIHACVNDCFLFRADNNKDAHFCPVCKTSKWKDSNTSKKKVPKKVLRYFSIIPKLQRLYKSSHTAKEMTWHATEKCMGPDSSFMLTLSIYGPKFPGKDIDVYLRPLIDDLKVLWVLKGVDAIDIATGQKFNMRAMVLWTINDFSALSSLSGWSGQSYLACPTYNKDTPRSLEFNGEIEDEDPPRKFNRDQIPALDRYQCGHPTAPAKVVQYQQGFPQGSVLGYKPRDQDVRCREHQAATSPGHYLGRLGCPYRILK
uniref:Uncharacterized protein n=1 Tax=Tanacetum cinerariifolium TaxID=118510 RepID=A0A6L2L4W7_TANCI|nr:hypothetical protein [Tanacetum cinerariifolium]